VKPKSLALGLTNGSIKAAEIGTQFIDKNQVTADADFMGRLWCGGAAGFGVDCRAGYRVREG